MQYLTHITKRICLEHDQHEKSCSVWFFSLNSTMCCLVNVSMSEWKGSPAIRRRCMPLRGLIDFLGKELWWIHSEFFLSSKCYWADLTPGAPASLIVFHMTFYIFKILLLFLGFWPKSTERQDDTDRNVHNMLRWGEQERRAKWLFEPPTSGRRKPHWHQAPTD